MADICCENCGWSEIVGSPIICNYNGHRTWRDECCDAWKPKETNMVEVVRCKDCKHRHSLTGTCVNIDGACFQNYVGDDWYCADGEHKEGR